MKKPLRSWVQIKEKAYFGFFFLCGAAALGVLAGIFILLLCEGWPAVKAVGLKGFFGEGLWRPDGFGGATYALWPAICGTILTTSIALLLGIPLGIGTACYLSFVASESLREWLKPLFELLASVPSVVIGFFGLVVTGPLISSISEKSHGLNALNGGILLALMSLPTIISVSEDVLQSLPRDLWRASLALGATRYRTIVQVMLPAGQAGLFAAIMLGMGRAIGETMTVLMATGNAIHFPASILDSVRTLTATIAMELGEVAFGSDHYHALFVVGAVLFVMTFAVNLAGELVMSLSKAK
jgi:phosphate transport system permease protein